MSTSQQKSIQNRKPHSKAVNGNKRQFNGVSNKELKKGSKKIKNTTPTSEIKQTLPSKEKKKPTPIKNSRKSNNPKHGKVRVGKNSKAEKNSFLY